MKILVVGAGATGGYFGGRLAQAGRDITFLVRPARAERLRARGLEIVSPFGDVKLAPKLVTAGAIDGPYDAVLFTVKAYSADTAIEDLAPAVGPDTMILSTLNGMKHVDLLAARFGTGAVVGCVCKVAATLDAEGRIVQLARFQELAYGELRERSADGASPRLKRLDAALQDAGFDARLTATIEREMWEKWTLLATLGGATCLMRGTIGDIVAAPGGEAFVNACLDEVLSVVRAVGVAPADAFVASVRSQVTQPGSPMASSMYRDLTGGHAVETEQILGDLIARGAKAGIAMPLIGAAHAHLSIYSARRAAATPSPG